MNPFALASASCGSMETSALYPWTLTTVPSTKSTSMKLLEIPGFDSEVSILRLFRTVMVLPCVTPLLFISALVKEVEIISEVFGHIDDVVNFCVCCRSFRSSDGHANLLRQQGLQRRLGGIRSSSPPNPPSPLAKSSREMIGELHRKHLEPFIVMTSQGRKKRGGFTLIDIRCKHGL